MIAAGRLDGPMYLEDAIEIGFILALTGRFPLPEKWIERWRLEGEASKMDEALKGIF